MGLLSFLINHDAHPVALKWAAPRANQPLQALWDTCPKGEYLLWVAHKAGVPIPEAAYMPGALRAERLQAALDNRPIEPIPRPVPQEAAWAYLSWGGTAAFKTAERSMPWEQAKAAKYAEQKRCADEVRSAMVSTVVEALEKALGA